jgi:hypothetical protein
MPNNEQYKAKGKCRRTLHRSIVTHTEIKAIEAELRKSADNLKKVIENTEKTFKALKPDFEEIIQEIVSDGPEKHRSMIAKTPMRIEFKYNSLKFYIDFTLVPLERDDLIEINGSIIYGTNRTLCFLDCIYPAENENPKNNNNKNPVKGELPKCENCERILRCDRLEDKPLIQFLVNRNGIIKCKDKLEDEMWTTENNQDLLDLHYRTLDLLWKDALDWVNEELLP